MMLEKLVRTMDRRAFPCQVASLVPGGVVGDRIRGLGIEVEDLSLSRGRPRPGAVLKLARLLRDFSPQVVQTWMYHADLLGLAAARLARTGKVAWNIRCSDLDLSAYSRMTALTVRACALLSRFPDAVVANSSAGREFHRRLGYHPKRFPVIGNGFDLSRFVPDPKARDAVRRELGVPAGAPLVGLVARWDPAKDHAAFFQAAGLLVRDGSDARFVLCGQGVDPDNPDLARWIREQGLSGRVSLLGLRDDVPRIMAALDVFASSSRSEGFPNVLGEAMASGVPCAVTDVGDSAEVVGEWGVIVPPGDPQALAMAVGGLLALSPDARKALGALARERVGRLYSMEAVARAYEDLYRELAGCAVGKGPEIKT